MLGSEKSAPKGKYTPVAQKEDGTPGSNVKSVHIPMEDEEEGEGERKEFVASHGLSSAEAAALLEKWGRNELEEHHKPKVLRNLSLWLDIMN
jgi:hypothetical protein